MTDIPKAPPTQEQADRAARWIIGILIAAFLGITVLVATLQGGSSRNPDDYTPCSEMASNPGTDFANAWCVDDSGDVVKFKDSGYNVYIK